MTTGTYTYDIAFSFVQQDENLALELYKLLKDRLICFIYSEQQKRLAGADGEKEFNSIFSKESRIVVVLFRKEWGNTKWTKIEETAIRNKGFEKGYDFVILIPTENKCTPPEWLPKNRIWVGLERWGVESAASVIEARVQDFGGVIKIESISDKIVRTEQEIKDKNQREALLNSSKVITLANNELNEVIAEIKRQEAEIKSKTANWHIKVRKNNFGGCDIISYGYYLTFQYYQYGRNSPDGGYLYIGLFHGYFDENGSATDPFSENKRIEITRVRFDIDEFNQYGWTLTETRGNFMTSIKLVVFWFDKLTALIIKDRLH